MKSVKGNGIGSRTCFLLRETPREAGPAKATVKYAQHNFVLAGHRGTVAGSAGTVRAMSRRVQPVSDMDETEV